MEHRVEFLNPIEKVSDVLASSLCDQLWALKANVIFYFSYIPYRTEWRYGHLAHRIALTKGGCGSFLSWSDSNSSISYFNSE